MYSPPEITFVRHSVPKKGTVAVLSSEGGALGEHAKACDASGMLERIFKVSAFTGKIASSVDAVVPETSGFDRLIVIGAGKTDKLGEQEWLRLGGVAAAQARKATDYAIVLDLPDTAIGTDHVVAFAQGLMLRSYAFDKYKTRKEDGEVEKPGARGMKVAIHCADPAGAKKAFAAGVAVVDGVVIARNLVNEPANVLGPVEFTAKAKELEALGVKVEVLTEKEMKKLGMAALLGVAQGSTRPARMVVMQWNGGKAKDQPIAFVGKGVVFDSGGISIKPAAGMEDMKGDMGGAAAVAGLMHTLAARKAKANVVGIIGLVENMVDGNAQRPGDIVTSMSGQTIEILNTDAEGRLVLADALWYCHDRFKPRFMIDLATLTGAVIVALGQHYAGLFSNDDTLSAQLTAAGDASGERVWRLPLGPEYDKMIDSKNADVKNTGGRHAGASTAAQFLQRFVKDGPWAHLDIAGTAMGSPATDLSQSWASGYGVRLLDRLVRDNYEG